MSKSLVHRSIVYAKGELCTNLIGPDISFYQNDNNTPQDVDFVKMKAKTDGVIIRHYAGR